MLRFLLNVIRWVVGLFLATTILAVVFFRFVPVWFTPLMVTRTWHQWRAGEEVVWHHHWVPIEEISPHLPVAVMASEDQRFLLHHGFDFDAIQKAAKRNREGKKKFGASTITQQTVKNVFLWQGRSWLRKGLEAYFTALVEMLWGKHRIMEVYLNSIEMGRGIYGAEAVARDHFGKHAQDLSRAECARIAATLPNPIIMDSGNPSAYVKKRQHRIEREMKFIPSFPKEGNRVNPNTVSGGIYKK